MKYNYKIDSHTHTIASGHAYNTINEMIFAAMKKNVEVLCITDHGPKMPGSAHEFYFANYKVLPENYIPIELDSHNILQIPKIIFGMEANIIDYNGTTDYEMIGDKNNNVKFIIASFHPTCLTPSDIKKNTEAYIGAIKKPYVSVLGHIDDGNVPCDYEKIIKTAKEHNVLIEVNNTSNSPYSFRNNSKQNTLEYLQLCKENEVQIIMSSDAHCQQTICNFEYIIPLLNKVNFPEELIINRDKELFLKFIENKLNLRKNL